MVLLGDSLVLGGCVPPVSAPGAQQSRRIRLFARLPEVIMPPSAWAAQMEIDWMEAIIYLILYVLFLFIRGSSQVIYPCFDTGRRAARTGPIF